MQGPASKQEIMPRTQTVVDSCMSLLKAQYHNVKTFTKNLLETDVNDNEPVHVAYRSLLEEADVEIDYDYEDDESKSHLAEKGEKSPRVQNIAGNVEYQASDFSKITREIFLTFDSPNWSTWSKIVAIFMSGVVILSCFAYVLGTMSRFKYIPSHCKDPICIPGPDSPCTHEICFPQPIPILHNIEIFSMIVFTIDYLVRVLLVHTVPQRLVYPEDYVKGNTPGSFEPNGLVKTIQYALQPMVLIDLAAILPFYFHFFINDMKTDLVFLRLLRLLRVVRVFKLGRYTEGRAIIYETLIASIPALGVMLFIMVVLTILFGAIIFYCEEGVYKVTEEYPEGAFFRPSNAGGEEVSPFKSIPIGVYWVVMTATTVGYGDFFPSTTAGRIIAVIVAYSGIVSIAMPITIIGKHFNDIYFDRLDRRQNEEATTDAIAAGKKNDDLEKKIAIALPPSLVLENLPVATRAGGSELGSNIKGGDGSAGEEDLTGNNGLRKRALTNLIRDQLQRIDKTTKYLMDQLQELESLSPV